MITAIEQFIVKNLIGLIFAGALVGVLLPLVAQIFNPLILYMLMAVIYFAFLRMDFTLLAQEIKHWPEQLYLCTTTLIIIPIVIFHLSHFGLRSFGLDSDIAVGVLLLFGAPAAVLVPTFTMLIQGRFERSLLNLVCTTFIAPITLPLLLNTVAGSYIQFDYIALTQTLTLLIIVPFFFAIITKKTLPKISQNIISHIPAISVILLILIEIGGLAGFHRIMIHNPSLTLNLLILCTALLTIAFIIGGLLQWRATPIDKLSNALMATWSNIGLSLGIAQLFFKSSAPSILLFLTVMVLPWHLLLVIVKILGKKVR